MHRDIAMHCKHVQVHTIVSTFSAPCNIKALCLEYPSKNCGSV